MEKNGEGEDLKNRERERESSPMDLKKRPWCRQIDRGGVASEEIWRVLVEKEASGPEENSSVCFKKRRLDPGSAASSAKSAEEDATRREGECAEKENRGNKTEGGGRRLLPAVDGRAREQRNPSDTSKGVIDKNHFPKKKKGPLL